MIAASSYAGDDEVIGPVTRKLEVRGTRGSGLLAVSQRFKGGRKMEQFNEQLAVRVDRYIEALLNPQDEALMQNLQDAVSSGLPTINVSANEGKLLYLVAKIAGAKRVLEIGTLGGYSTTWLARAVPADGKVITLELDQTHAEVARRISAAGVADRVRCAWARY
jgi:predicted O-methyltransferase YrrM